MTKENIIGTKKERAKRINGSEFATVLGINPYKKRIELILEKAGVIADTFEGNDATRRGQFLENEIIARFEDKTGLKVWAEQREYSMQPASSLELCCHVDGLVGDTAIFEAKTTDIKSKVWENGIPDYYKAQLEFNCALADVKNAYIAVGYCKDNEIVDFTYYEYTAEMSIDDIVKHCQIFTFSVEDYKNAYGVVNNGKIIKQEINEEIINELEEINEKLADYKKVLKPLEDRKKELEQILKDIIGVNYGIENDLYKITMSTRITSPSMDYKISRSGLKIEYK